MFGATCLLGTAVAVTRPAAGQAAPVRPGDWVRVTPWGADAPVTGRVLEADSAFVSLRPTRDAAPRQFRYADLRRLEQRAGRESRGTSTLRGAGRGALVGLAGGVVFTAATFFSGADERCGDCFFSPTAGAAAAGVLLTGAGGVVGGAIGATRPRESWRSVRLAPRVGGGRGRAGAMGLAVRLAF
jgi:hypothetical protein